MSGPVATLFVVECPKCGGTEFYKPGQPGSCKPCTRARRKAHYMANREEALRYTAEYRRQPKVAARRRARHLATTEPKPCRRCGKPKPRVARRNYCDDCVAEMKAVSPDSRRSWEKRNPERAKAIKARERAKNRERIRAADLKRHREDPEANRARAKAWREANPERARLLGRVTTATRRARKSGLFVEAVDPVVLHEMHGGRCGICGEFIDTRIAWPHDRALEHDHVVPLAKGGAHSYANGQPAHRRCNMLKGATTPCM